MLSLQLCQLCLALALGAGNAYRWRALTEEEQAAWYSPEERCMVRTASLATAANSYLADAAARRRECGLGALSQTQGYCDVAGGACAGPLASRPSLLYGLDPFVHAHNTTQAHRLIRAARSANATLFFIGDSISSNYLRILVCQLSRENGTTSQAPYPEGHSIGELEDRVRLATASGDAYLDVYFFRAHTYAKLQAMSVFLRSYSGNCLVSINMGLHYRWPPARHPFRSDMQKLSRNMSDFASRPGTTRRVLWVETTHQGFPNPREQNGYYEEAFARKHTARLRGLNLTAHRADYFDLVCPRMQNMSLAADWRNAVAREEVEAEALRESRLSFVGTDGALRHVNDLFRAIVVKPGAPPDCTHFCFHPLLFQHLWHAFADAAEEMARSLSAF